MKSLKIFMQLLRLSFSAAFLSFSCSNRISLNRDVKRTSNQEISMSAKPDPGDAIDDRPASTIFFVRHGETEWNSLGKWQGQLDSPLSVQGVLQAETLGLRFKLCSQKIKRVYSSDLPRAMRTAEIIKSKLESIDEINIIPELRERNFGIFEGKTREEVIQAYPDQYRAFQMFDLDYSVERGESRRQVLERAMQALEQVPPLSQIENTAIFFLGGADRCRQPRRGGACRVAWRGGEYRGTAPAWHPMGKRSQAARRAARPQRLPLRAAAGADWQLVGLLRGRRGPHPAAAAGHGAGPGPCGARLAAGAALGGGGRLRGGLVRQTGAGVVGVLGGRRGRSPGARDLIGGRRTALCTMACCGAAGGSCGQAEGPEPSSFTPLRLPQVLTP